MRLQTISSSGIVISGVWGLLLISSLDAQISCFFSNGFCGWVPSPAKVWTITDWTHSISGSGSYFASASGATRVWAELKSEPFNLTTEGSITFRAIQLDSGYGTPNYWNLAELYSDYNETSSEYQWGVRNAGSWVTVTRKLRPGVQQLRFVFLVGNPRYGAGVKDIYLQGKLSPMQTATAVSELATESVTTDTTSREPTRPSTAITDQDPRETSMPTAEQTADPTAQPTAEDTTEVTGMPNTERTTKSKRTTRSTTKKSTKPTTERTTKSTTERTTKTTTKRSTKSTTERSTKQTTERTTKKTTARTTMSPKTAKPTTEESSSEFINEPV